MPRYQDFVLEDLYSIYGNYTVSTFSGSTSGGGAVDTRNDRTNPEYWSSYWRTLLKSDREEYKKEKEPDVDLAQWL